MYGKLKDILTDELKNIEEAGLWKAGRIPCRIEREWSRLPPC